MAQWMGRLPDDMKLKMVKAIPGTHQSGAIASKSCNVWWPWARCQSMPLVDQLKMGVRKFDFRLCNNVEGDKGQIYIAHRYSLLYVATVPT